MYKCRERERHENYLDLLQRVGLTTFFESFRVRLGGEIGVDELGGFFLCFLLLWLLFPRFFLFSMRGLKEYREATAGGDADMI